MAEEKKYTFKELQKKLTEKERIFCHEYIIDWNKARAARVAGYSEENARQIGYDTYTKLYIQQYIEFIKNDFEKEAGISKLRQIQEFSKIAYSNISGFHDTWITRKEFEDIPEEQKAAIESIDTKTVVTNYEETTKEIEYIKIKLYSKLSALSEINKMMGYNAAEKITHTIITEQPLFSEDEDSQ